ncbi:hypothetical protein PLAN_20013 [Planktothrix rubescens CCAP 1459/22]|uniref:Uncharacterized protein n=1 Tax=Planktothrix rubescens CCAP 1459/22 TaxID=329571 RepID=A0A6J7ZJT2_PLARU|nr:hypothetical protein PLAN_20013 [Planktothrix rubescens NIVA-CYA 18]
MHGGLGGEGTPDQGTVPPTSRARQARGGEGTPGEITSPSGFQDPSGVLTALAVAITG